MIYTIEQYEINKMSLREFYRWIDSLSFEELEELPSCRIYVPKLTGFELGKESDYPEYYDKNKEEI